MAKARLMIDFESEGHLAQFVAALRADHNLPENVGVYESESLDFIPKSGGIGRAHTYLLLDGPSGEGRKRLKVKQEDVVV